MQCEEDRAVMQALYQGHGWSIALWLLTECLVDLGGAPTEVLTDRDPALVIGSTPSGRAVFAPEWVDLAEVLGLRPRACRPYRAKTKGKVERVIRELKEDFLAWATGQPMPPRPCWPTTTAWRRGGALRWWRSPSRRTGRPVRTAATGGHRAGPRYHSRPAGPGRVSVDPRGGR